MFEMPFSKIKYESTLVTFTEVPDEIALCFNVSGCPCNCEGCFEPWLREDIGEVLTYEVLKELYLKNKHCSCICFMGGDRYYDDIAVLTMFLKRDFPNLKVAFYSGGQEMNPFLSKILDYYKVGPYVEKYGPMNKTTTNQRFYKKENNEWVDITYRFQKEKI